MVCSLRSDKNNNNNNSNYTDEEKKNMKYICSKMKVQQRRARQDMSVNLTDSFSDSIAFIALDLAALKEINSSYIWYVCVCVFA